jgi:hypothetical protein
MALGGVNFSAWDARLRPRFRGIEGSAVDSFLRECVSPFPIKKFTRLAAYALLVSPPRRSSEGAIWSAKALFETYCLSNAG